MKSKKEVFMKCASCNVNIDPKWKYAIEQNVCPFCGNNIMDEYLKNLLIALSDTMDKLSAYEEHLNDFMLSNFQFIKTSSPNLIDYLPQEQLLEYNSKFKSNTKNSKVLEEKKEVNEEVHVNNEITSEIFKRADLLKDGSSQNKFNTIAEKMAYIKSIAEKERNKKADKKTASVADININKLLAEDFSEFSDNLPDEDYNDDNDIFSGDDLDKIPSSVLNAASKAKSAEASNKDLQTLKRLKEHADNLSSKFSLKKDM